MVPSSIMGYFSWYHDFENLPFFGGSISQKIYPRGLGDGGVDVDLVLPLKFWPHGSEGQLVNPGSSASSLWFNETKGRCDELALQNAKEMVNRYDVFCKFVSYSSAGFFCNIL